jgi:hypothetical protein
MKILLLSAALLFSTLFLFSCKKDNPIPPENQPQVNLTLEDTSCTEAWLKLTAANIGLPAEAVLMQNDVVIQTISLSTIDTLLYIDSLLPNHTYKFQSVIQSVSKSSNSVNVTTMDTTSHNFTFETFTFGGTAGSSTLYDVAIIDENDIWAVGEIYVADTSQNGYTMYNAVHWDGSQWELKRIFVIHNGSSITPPLYGIFAFSETDIWLSAGVPIHGDGVNWIQYHLFDMGILTQEDGYLTKIWGESSTNIYFVGTLGTIAHYQNGQWSRIESGTDLNINDIYGAYNERTNRYEILAVASDYPGGIDKTILSIKNDTAKQVSTNPIVWPLFTIWFIPNRQYYSAGSGIYQKHLIEDSDWKNKALDITTFTTTSMRGNNINDVVGVGAFGDLVHYNGISWKNDYTEPLLANGSYTSVTTKGNMIVAVGSNQISINSEAVILLGRR